MELDDNPHVQVIAIALLSVEVWVIEPHEQEGKAINSRKLEYHSSTYLCTEQFKDANYDWLFSSLMKQVINVRELSNVSILYSARIHDKGFTVM
jgi:hypothetical protein